MSGHIESLPVEDFEAQVAEDLPDGRVRLNDGRVGYIRRDGGFSPSSGAAISVPGNTAAVVYGAWSDRLVSEQARDVLVNLQEVCPWIVDADGLVLDTLIKSKVRHDLLDEYIDDVINGAVEVRGRKGEDSIGIAAVPERVWQQVSREARTVMECCGKLGLTATDRAALMKDTSWARALSGRTGAAAVADRGRAIREARGHLPE